MSDGAKAKLLLSRTERTVCDDSGLELLYPDIETHHAVVNRMKEPDRCLNALNPPEDGPTTAA